MTSNRPSYRELDKKLKAATAALIDQNGVYANPGKVVGELYELGIESQTHVWSLILELLEEITPDDYAGGFPPQKSYERTIENQELFAFCWHSQKLGKKMYHKFALKDNRYYYVSLHKSKEWLWNVYSVMEQISRWKTAGLHPKSRAKKSRLSLPLWFALSVTND